LIQSARAGSATHTPERKKCTSGVEKESNDPIKTQKEEGIAGVVSVFKITPELVPEKRQHTATTLFDIYEFNRREKDHKKSKGREDSEEEDSSRDVEISLSVETHC
jgi:hypothetical protein